MSVRYADLRKGQRLYLRDKDNWSFEVLDNKTDGIVVITTFYNRSKNSTFIETRNLTAKLSLWDIDSPNLKIYPQRKQVV